MGIPGNQSRWDCLGSIGRRLERALIQAGQNPYKAGVVLSSKTPVKATDRRGITNGTQAKGFARLRSPL